MMPMLNDILAKKLFKGAEILRGEYISAKLEELNKNQLMSERKIYENSMLKLKKLLAYASSHSPFYQERLKDINLAQIKTFNDLKTIEPVSKEELRDNVKLIESTKPISKTTKAKTSGSTGVPLVFPKDSIRRAF